MPHETAGTAPSSSATAARPATGSESPETTSPDSLPVRRILVELVRASFVFPLEREPKESILREFDLTIIGRYFPDYEREVGAQTSN